MKSFISKKNLFLIGLVLAIIGIVVNVLFCIVNVEYFKYIGFLDFLTLSSSVVDLGYNQLNYMELIFLLYLIVGLFKFRKTGEDRSGILKFIFSIIGVSSIVSILTLMLFLINITRLYLSDPESFSFLGSTSYPLISAYFLGILSLCSRIFILWLVYRVRDVLKSDEVQNFKNTYAGWKTKNVSHRIVSLRTRLGHRVFDTFLAFLLCKEIVYVLFRLVVEFIDGRSNYFSFSNIANNRIGLNLFFFVSAIIFYLVYSLFYKTTATKYLSRSIVLDSKSFKSPSRAQMLKRTFARFIPFGSFAFLAGKHNGLHDTISKTRVIRLGKLEEGLSQHLPFMIICILCLFGDAILRIYF